MRYRGLAGLSALFLCAVIVLGAASNWDSYVGDDGRYEYDYGLPMDQSVSPEAAETIVGRLGSATFPMEPHTSIGRYFDVDALTIQALNASEYTTPLFLYGGPRYECIPAGARGNSVVGGITYDELSDAYKLELTVEVEGRRFSLLRENRTYSCFSVESARVLEPEKAPLVIYSHKIETMFFDPPVGGDPTRKISIIGDRIDMPHSSKAGTVVSTESFRKEIKQIYRVILNPGDCIGYDYNASEPVDFTLYSPETPGLGGNETYWGVKCHEETGTSPKLREFIALTRGEYSFVFNAAPPTLANVTFNLWRIARNKENVLFLKRGSHSSDLGSMGTMCFYPRELPERIVLGRTWSKWGAWTDHSYTYRTTLMKGTVIRFGFNSTQPINLSLSNRTDGIMWVTAFTHTQEYMVTATGDYTFSLSVDKPRTALVSFRCVSPNYSVQQLNGSYPIIFGSISVADPEGDVFPPAINETIRLSGKLGAAQFPGTEGSVMTLETMNRWNGSRTYPIHLGLGEDMLPSPCGGYTMLGNMSLYEVNDAYLNNVTVEVEGFPFNYVAEGIQYKVFHVNAVRVLEQEALPLYAVQTMEVVSGRFHECLGGDEREYFPLEFRLGFDEYEGHYGNIERFYHVHLSKGDSIRFSFNASGPVEFGLYGNRGDHYGTMGFGMGDPDDYYIRKSRIEALGMESPLETLFTAPRRGYYSFAFKAYSGAKTLVELDVQRAVIRGEGFTP
ncbi:hypothetical protein KAU18_09445 [Candidatus Bathyarchaeota archaeon]|nr:hypothetical protein [Candidatus Bathyarchaeota archaeon]